MKRFVIPAAVLCLVICGTRWVSADDWFTEWFHAESQSSRTEEESGSNPLDDTAAGSSRIRESEATGTTDVLILRNGNRFEGLILGETATQITLARYSSNVSSPHTLRVSKRDIAWIERVRPELRAPLETKVRALLDSTQLARRQAEIARWQKAEAAGWQQLAETAVALQRTFEAAQRENLSRSTQKNQSRARSQPSRMTATRTAGNTRQYRTARRVASASRPRVRAAGKG